MFEAVWIAIVTIIAGVAFGVERSRRVEGPSGYWVSAVGALFASGLCGYLLIQPGGSSWLLVAQFALFTVYPTILLAGALNISGRRVPGWMVPAAAGLGVLGGLMSLFGPRALAVTIALVFAPATAGTAALAASFVTASTAGASAVSSHGRAASHANATHAKARAMLGRQLRRRIALSPPRPVA